MSEMSLERACEWMNRVAWDGVDDWEVDQGYAYSPSRQRRFTAAWAIAEAAKFATHLAVPPAERAGGQLSGNSEKLAKAETMVLGWLDLYSVQPNSKWLTIPREGLENLLSLLLTVERRPKVEIGEGVKYLMDVLSNYQAMPRAEGPGVPGDRFLAVLSDEAVDDARRELNMDPPL